MKGLLVDPIPNSPDKDSGIVQQTVKRITNEILKVEGVHAYVQILILWTYNQCQN